MSAFKVFKAIMLQNTKFKKYAYLFGDRQAVGMPLLQKPLLVDVFVNLKVVLTRYVFILSLKHTPFT